MKNEKYESRDLMIAAALLSEGVPLLGTKNNDGYITFIFSDVKKCKELEQQWWSGSLTVVAPRYAECTKRLKGLVYAKR